MAKQPKIRALRKVTIASADTFGPNGEVEVVGYDTDGSVDLVKAAVVKITGRSKIRVFVSLLSCTPSRYGSEGTAEVTFQCGHRRATMNDLKVSITYKVHDLP